MTNIHDELHSLSNALVDIKVVIQESTDFMASQYKRHKFLLENSKRKMTRIQEQIDDMIARKRKGKPSEIIDRIFEIHSDIG